MMTQTFKTKDGLVIEADRVMQAPKLHKGYSWSKNFENNVWEEVVDLSCVNSGMLFGYEEKDFLRKQYR